ncbi:unnamed protein product [Boreogadus saida]
MQHSSDGDVEFISNEGADKVEDTLELYKVKKVTCSLSQGVHLLTQSQTSTSCHKSSRTGACSTGSEDQESMAEGADEGAMLKALPGGGADGGPAWWRMSVVGPGLCLRRADGGAETLEDD